MDLGMISEILNVAGTGAQTTGKALEVIDRIKSLAKGKDDDSELKRLVGDLAEDLFKTRISNLEIVTKLQELQRVAEREDRFERLRSNYRPHTLPEGGRVLRLIQGASSDQSELWEIICPVCAEKNRQLVPLQGAARTQYYLNCPNCESKYPNATFDVSV